MSIELSEIHSIAEVTTGGDFNESRQIMAWVDNYFEHGWVLLGIHQRGYARDTTLQTTVYIFGHKDVHALHPGRSY